MIFRINLRTDSMSDDLFLITGGGTGAKVAESLVHLCAAGLGPDRLHLLLIDSDTANGNLQRTKETIRSYNQMQKWPWHFRPRSNGGSLGGQEPIGFFDTEIRMHEITEQIDTVHEGGLETAVESSRMQNVMDLLYDGDEQQATCQDGFRARPNLGCLLMTEHLNEQLGETGSDFIRDLEGAITGQTNVPVVVTASVFGGTGASLLPVIRGCVEDSLSNPEHAGVLNWNSVQLLPHYQPREKKQSVDPDRFFLDTSSALQYYSTTYGQNGDTGSLYDAFYMVGSDDPGRNTVKTVLGHGDQANPPYFEEVIAAFSVLDAASTREEEGQPVRVYVPNQLEWETLPHNNPAAVRERLALLLHVSAFYLSPKSRDSDEQLSNGLGAFIRGVADKDVQMYGWYDSILDGWARRSQDAYANADENRRVETLRSSMGEQSVNAVDEKAAEYLGRFLLWSETAMKGEGLPFIDYDQGSYARIYDAMSDVDSKEINIRAGAGGTVETDEDNALIRLLRAAAASLAYDDQRATPSGLLDRMSLLDGQNRVPLRVTKQEVRKTLRAFNRETIVDAYTKTRP